MGGSNWVVSCFLLLREEKEEKSKEKRGQRFFSVKSKQVSWRNEWRATTNSTTE
jgi:hypothetical protein